MTTIFTNYILILVLSTQLFAVSFTSTPKKLSAHYVAPSQNIEVLIKKLKNNGFVVLATTHVLDKYNIITITNQELKDTNSYMATLQINVNEVETRVQNPSYLAAAYLGKSYKYGQFKNTINALERVLGSMENGFQKANFSTLSQYRFMYGLPKKEDILIIKKAVGLIDKVSTIESKKYIAYTLALPNGTILIGHKLRAKTNEFLKILAQEKNAQVLPYEAMIREGEVSIMNPKYYLALSFPELSLHQFMQIASVPDQIYRNIEKAYR